MYKSSKFSIATFISVVLFNVAKFVFLRVKLGMNPFTGGTIAVLFTGLLAMGLGFLVPIPSENIWGAIAGLVLRSVLIAVTYLGIVLYFRFSPDLNALVSGLINRLRNR